MRCSLRGISWRGKGLSMRMISRNTLPWDAVFLSPAEQPEKAVRPGNDECGELPVRQPAFHVAHIAQAAAVADVDDLLAPEIPDPALHRAHPLP